MSGVPESWKALVTQAVNVRKNAYAPYSRFQVGCAIEDDRGRVFTGCNVENASYPESICAERTAIAKMVSEGGGKVARVAIVTESLEVCFPCGGCRQVLQEFGLPKVFSTNPVGDRFEEISLEELLPKRFSSNQLTQK